MSTPRAAMTATGRRLERPILLRRPGTEVTRCPCPGDCGHHNTEVHTGWQLAVPAPARSGASARFMGAGTGAVTTSRQAPAGTRNRVAHLVMVRVPNEAAVPVPGVLPQILSRSSRTGDAAPSSGRAHRLRLCATVSCKRPSPCASHPGRWAPRTERTSLGSRLQGRC